MTTVSPEQISYEIMIYLARLYTSLFQKLKSSREIYLKVQTKVESWNILQSRNLTRNHNSIQNPFVATASLPIHCKIILLSSWAHIGYQWSYRQYKNNAWFSTQPRDPNNG